MNIVALALFRVGAAGCKNGSGSDVAMLAVMLVAMGSGLGSGLDSGLGSGSGVTAGVRSISSPRLEDATPLDSFSRTPPRSAKILDPPSSSSLLDISFDSLTASSFFVSTSAVLDVTHLDPQVPIVLYSACIDRMNR